MPDQHENPLLEPSLFYDPPYERPLEDEFAWHLVKYLTPITQLRYQVKAITPVGRFWVDFVVDHEGRRFGFEIGALDEPEEDAQQTRYHDAILLGTGAVDVLYRFRGDDLYHRLHDTLFVVRTFDPSLFSRAGQTNLHRLTSPEVRAWRPALQPPQGGFTEIRYRSPEEEAEAAQNPFTWPSAEPATLVVRRLSRDDLAPWTHDYHDALSHYGASPVNPSSTNPR